MAGIKTPMRTPISYYGGNQSVIGHILPLIPEHEIYTECYFGGGTVFFAKEPTKNETINDKLDVVINFYQVLKTKFRPLKKMIDKSLISRTMHRQALAIVKGFVPADDVTMAWAFWYTCNFSFSCKIGGGIKYANDMHTIVTSILLNKKKEFTDALAIRIENAQIENNDALKVLASRNVPKAFHFLDTPYPGADQGHYSGYTFNDLEKQLDWCASACTGKFMMLNYQSEMLSSYITSNGWQSKEIVHRLAAPRKSGPAKTLVMVWNYNLPVTRNLFTDIETRS